MNTDATVTSSDTSNLSIYLFVFTILFFLTDFLPKGLSVDISGIQWMYLSIITTLFGVYTFITFKKNKLNISLKLNPTIVFYTLFLFLSGISVAVANNTSEGIISITQFVLLFCVFIFFSIQINTSKAYLLNFSILMSILLLFKSTFVLSDYLANVGKINTTELNKILSANTGNKNIFASVIMFQIPFAYYCFNYFKTAKKYFFLAAIFFGSLLIFIIGSRTNIVGLIVMVLLLLSGFIKSKTLKENKTTLLVFSTTILLSFLLSFASNKKSEIQASANSNTVLTTTSKANQLSGNRFTLWQNTLQIANNKPILGNGLGNYKIEVIPLESKQRDYWGLSSHSHNDFLQVASESGYLTGLFYLLIFASLFFYSLKKIKTDTEELNWKALIVCISIVIYGIDSMFNFPLYRPITQLNFVFILILFYSLYSENETKSKTINATFLIISLTILSFLFIFPNSYIYKSFKAQNKIALDEEKKLLTFDEVNSILPNFPNIDFRGMPISATKAKYLLNEGRIDEAIRLLYSTKNENRNVKLNEQVLSECFRVQKNHDSVVKYTKQTFEMYPLFKPFFRNYLISLKKNNQINEFPKVLQYAKKYNSPTDYDAVYDEIINIKGKKVFANKKPENNSNSNIPSIENPNTKQSSQTNYYAIAEKFGLDKKFDLALINYEKALENEPNNPIIQQNIGICNIMLKNYPKGIESMKKVFNNSTLNDGKTEYYLGIAYFNSGDKNKFCEFITIAKNKNYPASIEIANKYCK